MILLGLTGSIGMGKSTTARMFAEQGIPVFDADAAVHAMYENGGEAVPAVAEFCPEAIVDGAVDRARLSAFVVGNSERIARLEAIVHPLVRAREKAFLEDCRAGGHDIAVLDIPLLYETGGEDRVDRVVVVSAAAEIQRERVLARPGMTEDKFRAILAKQVPDAEKRRRADYIVDSGPGMEHARSQVAAIVADLRESRKLSEA